MNFSELKQQKKWKSCVYKIIFSCELIQYSIAYQTVIILIQHADVDLVLSLFSKEMELNLERKREHGGHTSALSVQNQFKYEQEWIELDMFLLKMRKA